MPENSGKLLLLHHNKVMKNTLFLLIAILVIFGMVTSCSPRTGKEEKIPADIVENPNTASGKADPGKLPKIEFEKDFHDFGKIIQGEKVTFAFKFKNTGKALLLISNVSTSCGCTISDFPKEPVLQGGSGTIDVSFDSESKRGPQNKTITVFANTQPNSTVLRIQALVMLPGDK
jgi:hypothetical protein